jgi:hypothetical protein
VVALVVGIVLGISQLYIVYPYTTERRVGIPDGLRDCFSSTCGPPPIVGYETDISTTYYRGLPIPQEDSSAVRSDTPIGGLPDKLTIVNLGNFLIFALGLPLVILLGLHIKKRLPVNGFGPKHSRSA